MEELWKNVPEFPQFKDLSLEDKTLFDSAFTQFPPVISEFTFTNLFIWRHTYQIKISRLHHFLIILSDKGENSFFFPTLGEGNVIECYRILLQYLKGKGIPPKLTESLKRSFLRLIGREKVLALSSIETNPITFT